MLNEIDEFRAYTTFPEYTAKNKYDSAYLGLFTFDTLVKCEGLNRVLTVLARGYLWRDGEANTDRAYDALRAWCSIPDRKNARPRREGQSETDYRALHGAFPELVDEDGAGWYYRHVHQVVAFVRKHPDKVLKSAVTSCDLLKKGFDEAWRDKLRQMQVPIFSPSTKADWPLRFDDIVADAMEEGPLRGEPVPLSAGELERLRAFTPKGIPETVLPALVQFYRMNKPEDGDWVVLPVANFDAYFGTTAFGRKWLAALPETVIRRSESSYGVSRYRVEMILI
jgi:hypothetical protein